ncbi:MAG: tyrosine decarboxylase MfnA [Candidatus Bathyarchaeota archaeon]|jgi:tyrosine decarboxylase/aspartate 1-decarboxylase
MQEKGTSESSILNELETRLKGDFTYTSGRIIGSMCTSSHPLSNLLQNSFPDRNLGDSGLFPALARLEEETIKMLGTLLSNPEACGHIVTGGTEANILALWTARKISKKSHGEVIIPDSAHCSLDKATELLGLRKINIGLNERHQINIDSVQEAISPKTVAIVGIAGTTGLGVVDPIPKLSEIAKENELYLHVDAAFGGFVLPFLRQIHHDIPAFDFSLPGVSSITVDPHKMGLAPIPAGGILFRNRKLWETAAWKVSYLAGGNTEQATLVGTRPGGSVIAVWALLKHLGKTGYRKIVENCMNLTHKLEEGIKNIDGIGLMHKPTMNIVGIGSNTLNIHKVAKELRQRKWAISLFPKHIRIVIMPHIKREHINMFLEDLQDVVNKLNNQRGKT